MASPPQAAPFQPCELVPKVDVAPLLDPDARAADLDAVATQLGEACERFGFFTVAHHGCDPRLRDRLHRSAAEFFALPTRAKDGIAMRNAGPAWRGWFPLGGELTGGIADAKEGLYFGDELPMDHPRVVAGVPLHGSNLFPEEVPALRGSVLEHMAAMSVLGRRLMGAIGRYLDVEPGVIDRLCTDPTVLFRIFRYPARETTSVDPDAGIGDWGVAEHTDYGLLTLLDQDVHGGLEVRVGGNWIAVDPDPETLVCNLGDMLERMTGGRFRSTPHRVRRPDGDQRLSFPFFFDPSWDATIPVLGVPVPDIGSSRRWDATDPVAYDGIYGDYLLDKVRHVFPTLGTSIERGGDTQKRGGLPGLRP